MFCLKEYERNSQVLLLLLVATTTLPRCLLARGGGRLPSFANRLLYTPSSSSSSIKSSSSVKSPSGRGARPSTSTLLSPKPRSRSSSSTSWSLRLCFCPASEIMLFFVPAGGASFGCACSRAITSCHRLTKPSTSAYEIELDPAPGRHTRLDTCSTVSSIVSMTFREVLSHTRMVLSVAVEHRYRPFGEKAKVVIACRIWSN